LRRDRKSDGEWLILPAEGRPGDPPAWPFPTFNDREIELWATLWTRPVAVLWERDRQVEYVALYVRTFVEAEQREASASQRTLVRQMAGELLLTIPAMHSARVKIATDELADKRNDGPAAPRRASARDRIKVVASGGQ
jgi:hypothetical protein